MSESELSARAEAVRRFNRFYTQKIGVLRRRYSGSYSLTEVRVLYELAHAESPTAAVLSKDLGVDQGYLSRMLSKFARRKLVESSRSEADGRARKLSLTRKGAAVLEPIDARAHAEIVEMLSERTGPEQVRLLDAMRTIEEVLAGRASGGSFVLREERPGDIGWIVQRHGELYAREQGWDGRFEALVAGIAADFAKSRDPARERCFIAEKDGENVGSVLLVEHSKTTAQLRLLLVEPKARGQGVGGRLVDECVRFARRAGYRRIMLWTDARLAAARRIYERAGFRLVATKEHDSYGCDLVGEKWEVSL